MNVLIIGGVGFLGRHLSLTIRSQRVAKNLCIVDKRVPEMVHLSTEMMDAINPYFQQADMCNSSVADRIFKLYKWDWVFNLQSELPFDANECFFEADIYKRSLIVGEKAAEYGVQCFIHCSGTEVYKSSSKLQDENAELNPSTTKGKWVLKTEQGLQAIPELKLIIVRPALTWGLHCTTEFTSYLAFGSIHQYLGEDLIYPMRSSARQELEQGIMLRKSMIHVSDVVDALLHLARWYDPGRKPSVVIYNLASPSGYRQDLIVPIYKSMFRVNIRFLSRLELLGFKQEVKNIVDDMNEKLLEIWARMLREGNISNTPVSPYMCVDFVKMNGIAADGRRVEVETGFKYRVTGYPLALALQMLEDFVNRRLYPRVLGKGRVAAMQQDPRTSLES